MADLPPQCFGAVGWATGRVAYLDFAIPRSSTFARTGLTWSNDGNTGRLCSKNDTYYGPGTECVHRGIARISVWEGAQVDSNGKGARIEAPTGCVV